MAPWLYDASVPFFVHNLKNLRHVLEKGEAWLKENNLPESKLLDARLAPDMFPLTFQVQCSCDNAQTLLTYIGGAKIDLPPRNEKTFADLYARIAQALSWLEAAKPEDFEGKESRDFVYKLVPNSPVSLNYNGTTFLQEFLLANFAFHTTVTYALMRREGVNLGKYDYVGTPSKGRVVQ